MNRVRYREDRVPTPTERQIVRGRMVEWNVAKGKSGKYYEYVRQMSFPQAWKKYMREEQAALDLLLAKESNLIANDKVKFYSVDDVLGSLQRMIDTLDYTAMKAIRTFSGIEATEQDELIERKAA